MSTRPIAFSELVSENLPFLCQSSHCNSQYINIPQIDSREIRSKNKIFQPYENVHKTLRVIHIFWTSELFLKIMLELSEYELASEPCILWRPVALDPLNIALHDTAYIIVNTPFQW